MSVEITRTEKRWHWRTWNLLLQIVRASERGKREMHNAVR